MNVSVLLTVYRYLWNGQPLLISPLTTDAPSVCAHCGQSLVFEIQLTPGLVNQLKFPGENGNNFKMSLMRRNWLIYSYRKYTIFCDMSSHLPGQCVKDRTWYLYRWDWGTYLGLTAYHYIRCAFRAHVCWSISLKSQLRFCVISKRIRSTPPWQKW